MNPNRNSWIEAAMRNIYKAHVVVVVGWGGALLGDAGGHLMVSGAQCAETARQRMITSKVFL